MNSHDFLKPPAQQGDLGVLGHYRVIDELGRGGMGFVFRAEDLRLQRPVALKVMNKKIAATPHSRRRFLHEARAMAAVHHDHVVTIYEVGESNQTPFMAMELLTGLTLEELNSGGQQLDYEQIIRYARQIALGLSAAHSRGIVHRDIKPANIWLVEETDRVKILDFGLALASRPVDHLAGRGAVIGTPGYLSPEQARSEPLDDRSDLYSLGVVLYELCTRQIPIQSQSVPGQLISILAHQPRPIRELNSAIPKPLCELVHRLLHKEPRERPSSAKVLVEMLDDVEQQCHQQSEMAQTLNRLKSGLNEVVSQKSSDPAFEELELPDTDTGMSQPTFDPLGFPASPPQTSSGDSSAQRLAAARSTAKPATQPRSQAKNAQADKPAWLAYVPLIAIVALVVIALPVMTYIFTGTGHQDLKVVASHPDGDHPDLTEDPKQVISSQAAAAPKTSNRPSDPDDVPSANARADVGRLESPPVSDSDKTQATTDGDARTNATDQSNRVAKDSEGVVKETEALAEDRNKETGSQRTVAVMKPPLSDDSITPEQLSSPPKQPVAYRQIVIRTSDGRGADAMVQKGSSEKFGSNPSIGIQRRGEVETNHSYLRFDLAPLEGIQHAVDSASLNLSVVGKPLPGGAKIRLYGVPRVGIWPEGGIQWEHSFSTRELQGLPLLATYEANAPSRNAREPRRVEIESDALAKFIAASTSDTVTLVIAGSSGSNQFLRFTSRESPLGGEPQLSLHVRADAKPKSNPSR